MKELLAKITALNVEIADLEAKATAETDEAKKAVLTDMLEAKVAEFETAEGEVVTAKAAAKRAATIKELGDETEAKSKELDDPKVEDAGTDHNEIMAKREMDATSWAYLKDPSKGGRDVLVKMSGEMEKAVMVVDAKTGRAAPRAPSFLRDFCLPQPLGAEILPNKYAVGRVEGKASNDILISDASGSASGGASIVGDSYVPQLSKIPWRLDDLASKCWVKRAVGKTAQYPNLTQSASNPFGVAVAWGSEGASIDESDPQFSLIEVSTGRCAALAQASIKATRVNEIGMEAEMAMMFRGALSREFSETIIAGSGADNRPTGVNRGASITAGVAVLARQVIDTVSYTDLVGLQYECDDGIFGLGEYVISAGSDGAMKYIQGLDDTDGRPVLLNESYFPGLGVAPSLSGRPFTSTMANEADLGSRGDVIFGDWMQYAFVVDTDDMSIERSDDYAFNTGRATYRVIVYVGGRPIGYRAFAVLGDDSAASSSSSSSSSST